MSMHEIRAAFASKCYKCGASIKKGEPATYDVSIKKVYCEKCMPIAGRKKPHTAD